MITSTTELLNDLDEDGKPLSQASQASTVLQQLRRDFAMRYGCMQSWFLRASWLEKMKWLTQLLEGLKSIDSLALILNTLRVTCSKSTIYAGSQYSTNFVYDKALQDHNRGLHQKVLTETQESDIQWFKTLEDSEQTLMLIGLIRLGGGSIMHQIYERGSKLYHNKIQEMENGHGGTVLIKSESPPNSNANTPRKPRNSLLDQLPTIANRILSIKPDNETELEKYDPQDPFVIEVEKQKKMWNDMITKYRIQVEGKPPKSPKANKKKGASDSKSVKSSKKSEKSTKTSKSSKSGKKGKGAKGKGEDETLDRIQLLPIWIVKKIFCYLDAKTLKKVKTVNKYWTYAITDLMKEQKARKNLDKLIKKMEASVLSSQIQLGEQPTQLKEIHDTSSPKKRLLKLAERGATLPKLKGNLTKPLFNKCIVEEAVKLVPQKYILPVAQIKAFPRKILQAAHLYKAPSCMVNELGFTKFEEEKVKDDISHIYSSLSGVTATHNSGQISELISEEELKVI